MGSSPMRITKRKGFCYEILSFLYTLLLYSIRIYNYIYCLLSTILLKSSDKIVTNVIVCQIRTDIIPFALLLFASISQPFLSYFSIFKYYFPLILFTVFILHTYGTHIVCLFYINNNNEIKRRDYEV